MNIPVVWDGSYHFPLPNGEVIDPSFLPSFVDCDGVPLVPVQPVDLTLYSKFGGKPGGVPAVISGLTVSYDTASWGGFPVAYSENCGAWVVNGNDLMIGHGTHCNLTWNTIADVAAWLTANDPYGLVWTVNGALVEATTTGTAGVVYQLVTCDNLADALSALKDNQIISSPNNTISIGASGPQAPDNQIDYKIDVNYVSGTTPVITSDTAHPDAHSGKNTSYMGTPDTWIRIPWAASPTGFLVLPGYFQA